MMTGRVPRFLFNVKERAVAEPERVIVLEAGRPHPLIDLQVIDLGDLKVVRII